MGRTVLVVDDEPQIREILDAYLRRDGFEPVQAASGEQALAAVAHHSPDLVLLDVGLPDVDGIEVLRRLRANGDMPVILVTARTEELDRLIGLEVGADDYVTKPFSPREVVARVKAVLRRSRPETPMASDDVRAFTDLTISPSRREVTAHGEPVTLSALEFDLLAALTERPGAVLTRTALLQQVWGYDFFGDERVVDVHIRSLRQRLGDDAADPHLIGTVLGVGYKFLQAPS
ncbi:MAG: response regulator transcription factor [Micrococcales bacterium]|nr:response regulator transcription factor [Micrococcales bacterium]